MCPVIDGLYINDVGYGVREGVSPVIRGLSVGPIIGGRGDGPIIGLGITCVGGVVGGGIGCIGVMKVVDMDRFVLCCMFLSEKHKYKPSKYTIQLNMDISICIAMCIPYNLSLLP